MIPTERKRASWDAAVAVDVVEPTSRPRRRFRDRAWRGAGYEPTVTTSWATSSTTVDQQVRGVVGRRTIPGQRDAIRCSSRPATDDAREGSRSHRAAVRLQASGVRAAVAPLSMSWRSGRGARSLLQEAPGRPARVVPSSGRVRVTVRRRHIAFLGATSPRYAAALCVRLCLGKGPGARSRTRVRSAIEGVAEVEGWEERSTFAPRSSRGVGRLLSPSPVLSFENGGQELELAGSVTLGYRHGSHFGVGYIWSEPPAGGSLRASDVPHALHVWAAQAWHASDWILRARADALWMERGRDRQQVEASVVRWAPRALIPTLAVGFEFGPRADRAVDASVALRFAMRLR